jgi:formylglycine-generating enzyme required for sulfatase activity
LDAWAEAALLCYRCGSHIADGSAACGACGQKLSPGSLRQTAGTLSRRKGAHGPVEGAPFAPEQRAGAGEGIPRLLRLALVGIGVGALGTYSTLSALRGLAPVAPAPRTIAARPTSSVPAPPLSPPPPVPPPSRHAIASGRSASAVESERERQGDEPPIEAQPRAGEARAKTERLEAKVAAKRSEIAQRLEEPPRAADLARPVNDGKKPANPETKARPGVPSKADEEKGRHPMASTRPQAPVPAVRALSPPSEKADCPGGMALVPTGHFRRGSHRDDPAMGFDEKAATHVEVQAYCIDLFEYPNAAGSKPRVQVNYLSAEASCRAQSKRLCTEEEWERACKGPRNARYPYGNAFDPSVCNTRDAEDEARPLAPSGAFARCRSGYGVADLSGNVAEWTSSSFVPGAAERAVKGGASDRAESDARCAARKSAPPGGARPRLGFRCCADRG